MNKYLIIFIITPTIFLLGCSNNPVIIEETSEALLTQEKITESNNEIQETDSIIEPKTSNIILRIPEYNSPVESRYNLILDIPPNWGEVNLLADRGGYGVDEEAESPGEFEIYGRHYTIVTTTHSESGARYDEPLFMITSIPKEDKNHSAIPGTDKYITEFKDHAYFVRFEINNQDLLEEIQQILSKIKFE
jgi:hypothetical protein